MVSISSGFGGGYLPPIRSASLVDSAAVQARLSEAKIEADAKRLQAQAAAEGGSATLQYTYDIGPDGKPYISSIRVTKTTPDKIANGLAEQGQKNGIAQQEAELSASEQARVAELRAADVSVRNHELLHYRAASGIASGSPDYSYVQGPDGQYYAVAGAVHVQTTATADPAKSSRDAATMARAALAPGDASAADLAASRNALSQAAQAYGKALAATRAPQSAGIADITA